MPPFDALTTSLQRSGRRHRRAWTTRGKAHIEVKTLTRPGSEPVARHLERALTAVQGVHWAEVNAVLGRVVVAFEHDQVGVDDLVTVVEGVEEAHQVHRERFSFDRPDHPGDREPFARAMTALVADGAGMALGVFGSVLRSTPLPVELASVITLIDSEPRLRRLVENALGPAGADLGLSTINAIAQGFAQGPLGLFVDALYRAGLAAEAHARASSWAKIEPRVHAAPLSGPSHPIEIDDRPVTFPPGPIEQYADRAGVASLVGFGVTLATTRDPRRAASVLLAGIPKAARFGREAFAVNLGRTLADRGVLVTDSAVLRRLDRIDCVCVEASLLLTGAVVIDGLEVLPDADHVDVQQRLRTLFDRLDPRRVRRRSGWMVGPLDDLKVERDLHVRRALRRLGGVTAYAVVHRNQVMAVFTVSKELASDGQALVRAARDSSLMIAVAGRDLGLLDEVGGDLLVDGGDGLEESVRMLQGDGCSVALVCARQPRALRAADCAIEVVQGDAPVWSGDLMVFDGLEQAAFVVEATGVAHEVSRQSVALALAGSSLGSVLAITGDGAAASRAMTAVSGAALAAVINGTRAEITFARRPRPKLISAPPWHELEVDQVLELLGSTRRGLSADAVDRRRGPVASVASAPFRFAQAVSAELVNPLTPVLAGGAAVSAAVGSVADAAMIGAVTGLNALLGAGQHLRADRAVAALQRTSATMVRVRRGDRTLSVSSDELVPGAVILLDAGEVVPADARIMSETNLEVDEANLTGESMSVTKTSAPSVAAVLAERTSMLYEGTSIIAGTVEAVVVAVGEDTEASAGVLVAGQARQAVGVDARLADLTALTLPFAALGGIGVVASGLLRGTPLSRTLSTGVSLAVAAVPEGLPVLATLAQLSAARRLSQRGALVPNPRAIEALGRIEVLCTDKTGTLTEGRIELHTVSDGRQQQAVSDLDVDHRRIVAAARRASPAEDGERDFPHPTDKATVDGARRAGVAADVGAPGWLRQADLPFEPSRGYHATVGTCDDGWRLSVKGAPEVLVLRCRTWRRDGRSIKLDARLRRQLERSVDQLARQGYRVLAVAERRFSGSSLPDLSVGLDDDAATELELLGLLALADPVRPAAAAAIDGLRRAGVDVVMVTGDHPSTAEGIATELHLLDGRRVVTGAELEQLSDDELDDVLADVSVFARVTPADKVRIVAAYQRNGRPVAMTGDGANDAPAIALADAGIALGENSTAAARKAADVVITDERIETIVDAIVEGRAMWGSVRDALAILLGGNLGEIGFTVAASALTGRTPLTSRQILLVNLLTDVAPALAIAVRPPVGRSYDDLLTEGPDRSLGRSLERAIALRAVTTAAGAGAAWTVASFTGSPSRARTVGLVALVGTQLGQTVTTGGLHPTVLAAGIGSSIVLAGIVQTPGVSQFFGCTPLDPLGWAIALTAATAATGAAWVAPQLGRRLMAPGAGPADDLALTPLRPAEGPPAEGRARLRVVRSS
ncbi:MAG: HAD-IC family P-type ATPase [Actinomycetota bacterium]|nr:HAD-IC family P-type ATPase [Actinomycetota bacterium]